jgi:glutamate-1-semialdehyde aminotransferase
MQKKRILKKNKALLARAEKVIPRASQTLSKAPDQFVRGVSPYAISSAKGCFSLDVDGNKYIDLASSLGAIILGYQHPVVEKAVAKQRKLGTIFSLPGDIEVELAERLTKMLPFIEMVRFGLNGSDVTTAAVRVARAHTGRDHVAKCGYHGWADWSIATHPLRSGGIPQTVKDLTHEFGYNNIESLEKIFQTYPDQIAAVVLEPYNTTLPVDNFLQKVKDLAHKYGAVLVFDELVTGFRLSFGGAAQYFNVEPDLVCYGKAISNGEPLSVLAGRKEIMQALDTNNIFFSFTYGGYLPSIRASLAVLDFMKAKKVQKQLWKSGELLSRGYNKLATLYSVPTKAMGIGPMPHFLFKDAEGNDNLPLKSLFLQECAKEGILTNCSVALNYSLNESVMKEVLKRIERVFRVLQAAIQEDAILKRLEGPVIRPRSRPVN